MPDEPPDDDLTDRRHHFVTMLGNCADGARVADATLELEMEDGTIVSGVPVDPANTGETADEIDSTGIARVVRVGQTPVALEHVVVYTVRRP